jgi:hydroxymethylpyrimidine pyrophosphatase-like HAD family hydrolase
MRQEGSSVLQNLLIFVGGLALIFLAHTAIETASPTASRFLEVLGFALAGYAPIRLILSFGTLFRGSWRRKIIDDTFRKEVRVVSSPRTLPLLIVSDAEGCITPPHRTEVDLRKFQRLRAYCEFVKSDAGQGFPPLLIYTGRPQAYVEMLAQALGMIDNNPLDLPFVIENGAALYFPVSKRIAPLITNQQRRLVEKTRSLLMEQMPQNEFEPKTYMVTINAIPGKQTINELRQETIRILRNTDFLDSLTSTSCASAVDISPKEINKLSGLKKAIEEYYKIRPDRWERLRKQEPDSDEDIVKLALDNTVGLADSTSDLCVLKEVSTAYCSAHDVDSEVRMFIEGRKRFGRDHVIDQKHIDFVIAAIEKECGLRII